MIRRLLIIPMLALGLIFAAAAPAAAATASDVRGVWTGTDVDDSNQTLIIVGGGSTFRLFYFDDNATGACDSVPVIMTGSATLSGDTLTGTLSGVCFDGTRTGPFVVGWHYNGEPEPTLTDTFGAVYYRAG